jgi:hypothetical protein
MGRANYRYTERFMEMVADGLTVDLEVNDLVQVMLRNNPRVGRVVQVESEPRRYLVRFRGGERWYAKDTLAYLPTRRSIQSRAERVRQSWTPRERFDRARWAAPVRTEMVTYCGTEVFSVGET